MNLVIEKMNAVHLFGISIYDFQIRVPNFLIPITI